MVKYYICNYSSTNCQYFGGKLFWLDGEGQLIVFDLSGRSYGVMPLSPAGRRATVLTVVQPSITGFGELFPLMLIFLFALYSVIFIEYLIYQLIVHWLPNSSVSPNLKTFKLTD